MTTIYIYGLVDPRTDQIRYVGKTNNPKARMAQHMTDGAGAVAKVIWINELGELSLKPSMTILEEVAGGDGLQEERRWIEKLSGDGCELVNGAFGSPRQPRTPSIKKKGIIVYPIRLSVDEIKKIDYLKKHMGLASRAQVIKCLVNAARVRPSSIKFLQTDETNKVTA